VFLRRRGEQLDDRLDRSAKHLVSYQQDWISALATAARIRWKTHSRGKLDATQFACGYSILLAYHHFSRLMSDQDAEARRSEHLLRTIRG
jgi:hypothetical protein